MWEQIENAPGCEIEAHKVKEKAACDDSNNTGCQWAFVKRSEIRARYRSRLHRADQRPVSNCLASKKSDAADSRGTGAWWWHQMVARLRQVPGLGAASPAFHHRSYRPLHRLILAVLSWGFVAVAAADIPPSCDQCRVVKPANPVEFFPRLQTSFHWETDGHVIIDDHTPAAAQLIKGRPQPNSVSRQQITDGVGNFAVTRTVTMSCGYQDARHLVLCIPRYETLTTQQEKLAIQYASRATRVRVGGSRMRNIWHDLSAKAGGNRNVELVDVQDCDGFCESRIVIEAGVKNAVF